MKKYRNEGLNELESENIRGEEIRNVILKLANEVNQEFFCIHIKFQFLLSFSTTKDID